MQCCVCVRTIWCGAIDGALSIFSDAAAIHFFYLLHGGSEDCLVWFLWYNDASRGAGVCSIVLSTSFCLHATLRNFHSHRLTWILFRMNRNWWNTSHGFHFSESEADYRRTAKQILAKLIQLEDRPISPTSKNEN